MRYHDIYIKIYHSGLAEYALELVLVDSMFMRIPSSHHDREFISWKSSVLFGMIVVALKCLITRCLNYNVIGIVSLQKLHKSLIKVTRLF